MKFENRGEILQGIMIWLTLIICGMLLTSCESKRICGEVVDKYQRGRFNDDFHVVLQLNETMLDVRVNEFDWARSRAGMNTCVTERYSY
jgi:hypothetical protein